MLANTEDKGIYHLFTHGRSGELLIEGKWLNAKEIALWIAKNIDLSNAQVLNVYGCNFARGKKGRDAINYLENALMISIAASTNITGKDGDWNLETGSANTNWQNLSGYGYNLQCTGPPGDCDGDTVPDAIDEDDDNDGILDDLERVDLNRFATSVIASNLVVNPNNILGNTPGTGASTFNNFFNSAFISVTLPNTVPANGWLRIRFTVQVQSGSNTANINFLRANAAGNGGLGGSFGGIFLNGQIAQGQTVEYTFRNGFVATNRFYISVSGTQRLLLHSFDQIDANADIDRDGWTNEKDRDSDNDGCNDVVESGGNDGIGVFEDGILGVSPYIIDPINGRVLGTNATGGYDGITGAEYISEIITNVLLNPDPVLACPGSTASLTATPVGTRVTNFGATGSPGDDTTIPISAADYIYTWYLDGDPTPLSDAPPYSGTSTATLTVTNIPVAFDGNRYRVEVASTNNGCLNKVTSEPFEIRFPTAGTDGVVEICGDDNLTESELFSALTGSPDLGGAWTDAGGNPVVFPVTASGSYTYTVTGAGTCSGFTDASEVAVTVVPPPNAGIDGTVDISAVQSLTEAELFAELGGTPDTGGTWTDSGGNPVTFPVSAAGVYTYTSLGSGPCLRQGYGTSIQQSTNFVNSSNALGFTPSTFALTNNSVSNAILGINFEQILPAGTPVTLVFEAAPGYSARALITAIEAPGFPPDPGVNTTTYTNADGIISYEYILPTTSQGIRFIRTLNGSQFVRFYYISYPIGSSNEDSATVTVNVVSDPCLDGASTDGTPTASDSDGDGLNDVCDLDDDNDGILDSEECQSVVFLQDFEGTDALVYDSAPYYQPGSGNGNGIIDNGRLRHNTDIDGAVSGDECWGTTVAQQPTVIPNQNYYFSFELIGLNNVSPAQIEVYINGDFVGGPFSYPPNGVFSVPWNSGSATTADLSLRNLNANSAGNDFFLDSIRLSLCGDTDQDGIADSQDIDSDNDGCPDVLESGGNDPDSDGTLGEAPITVDGGGLVTGTNTTGGYDGANGSEYISDVISSVAITPNPTETCEGGNLTLMATPTGVRVTDFGTTGSTADDTTIPIPAGDYAYTWYLGTSTTPLTDTAPYSGTSTANLTITNVPVGFDGNQYRVEVTSLNTSCPTEQTIVLSIEAAPTADAGPATADLCEGDTYTAAATATGGTIAWTTSGDGTFADSTIEDAVYTPGTNDIAAGTVTLTMTVTGTNPGCGSTTASDTVVITIGAAPTVDAGSATADLCEGNDYTAIATATGGSIVWTTSGDGTFADSTIEDAVYTPGTNDIANGTVTLTMTVTGTNPGCGSTTASDTVVITIQNSSISLVKTAVFNDVDSDGCATANIDTVDYTFTVTNNGNTALSNIELNDPILGGVIAGPASGDANSNGILDTTETWVYNAGYTVNQADIDNGNVTNTATVQGIGCGGSIITDTSGSASDNDDPTVTPLCQNPAISLLKTSALNDENGDGFPQSGETITYSFVVINTGNVTIDNIEINDPLLGGIVCTIPTLAPATSDTSCTATYTITQADIDSGIVTNSAIAIGDDPNDNQVSDDSDDPNDLTDIDPDGDGDPDDPTDTPLEANPGIEATKTAQSTGLNVGDVITYTILIENTGNVGLNNIVLVDTFTNGFGDMISLTTGPDFVSSSLGSAEGSLVPGEVATYTATFIITQQAFNSARVINSVLASGLAPNGQLVQDVSDDGDDFDGNTADDPTETPLGCLEIFNEFSPNGDGLDETFVINCINQYPNNTLEVYNRWGNLIYKTRGYNNDWNGVSNGRAVLNKNEPLPAGTYYYILNLGNGLEPRVGWLYINR